MSDMLSNIQGLFTKVAIPYEGKYHTECLLEENSTNPETKLRKIHICFGETRREWFLLHPDAGRRCAHDPQKPCSVNSPHLSVSKMFFHHKVCDAVLFWLDAGQLKIAYFDLKSEHAGGVSKQFKSMYKFMHYVVSLSEQPIPIAKECAFYFTPDNPKDLKHAFKSNPGATQQVGIPVYNVLVYNNQKLNLNQFCPFLS